MKRSSSAVKISDPVAHANALGRGPFRVWKEQDLWGDYAPHYTTRARFGQADGVAWYNNCGPTAVTNLLVMVRRKRAGDPGLAVDDRALYGRVARYARRHLIYVNARKGPVKGTSDLRAGGLLRAMFRRCLGIRPGILLCPATRKQLLRSLDRGCLLYLMLQRHPAYRNHHLVGYGYTVVKSETTGETRTYLKVSDGHAAVPRYLDLEDFRGKLRFYYEVAVPD